MRFVDFEFDNHLLSEFGCSVCHINSTSSDIQSVDIGNQLAFTTINFPSYNKFKISSVNYEAAYSTVFEICKINCNDDSDMYFGETEITQIMRWLNRKEYKKFKALYENGELSNVYYMASFNIKPIVFGSNVIGFELTMTTDSSVGYNEKVTINLELSTINVGKSFHDASTEVGVIYPDLKVTCLRNGKLVLRNTADTRELVVDNCKSGEIITIHGETKEIESSINHVNLQNDYKYSFPRIINKIDNVENTFVATSIPCKVEISYSPRCKLGVI